VPYIDMVFSPTVVPWLCLTALKDKNSEMSNVNEVEAFAHLPVIDAAELAGCPRPQYWNDWFDHQKDDAYWRARSIERRLDRVKVPVLGISGWHDDARGTIRNYTVMSGLKSAPMYHVVMDAGAHKGIDYVNGYFGPQARIDRRELQLRWMDHYLKGIDNGVGLQTQSADTKVKLAAVGSRVYAWGERTLVGYNLDQVADTWHDNQFAIFRCDRFIFTQWCDFLEVRGQFCADRST